MYDNYYDEYMRNVLGYGNSTDYGNLYSMMPQDLYNMNTYMTNDIKGSQISSEDIEECYPEIYKIIYPMVKKVCMKNTNAITKKVIDDMTNEIYVNIEPNDPININVNVGNTSKVNSYSSDRDAKTTSTLRTSETKADIRENRGELRSKETRQRNFLLNDLIKILILRELKDRPGRPGGNRPPQRPPIRPPYPYPYPYYNYGLYE
ncbi:MAG: hypothetical protein IKF17_03225 [Clostridia bacterium]|nr:hypothetical protein [Clostridia bacterium]